MYSLSGRTLLIKCTDPSACKNAGLSDNAGILSQSYISSNIEIWQRSTKALSPRTSSERVAKYADMFSAMGTEPRLRIMQLLLSAHPEGLVVSEIQDELGNPELDPLHHLDKLRTEDLVEVQREGTFLRYTANTDALQELLQFLYAECCTRNQALKPQDIIQICK